MDGASVSKTLGKWRRRILDEQRKSGKLNTDEKEYKKLLTSSEKSASARTETMDLDLQIFLQNRIEEAVTHYKDKVSVKVSGDDEDDAMDGASVSKTLGKWRRNILDEQRKMGDLKTNEKKYKNLLTSSEKSASSRTETMDIDLQIFLQDNINAAIKHYKSPNDKTSKLPVGFDKQNLRKAFGELFQKTAGDFFQVKLAQFLNDFDNCFTCKGAESGTGSGESSELQQSLQVCRKGGNRFIYRPYAENPNLVNSIEYMTAFHKEFNRPAIASSVQLATFDVMAGLIGLQQTANVVLQTLTGTNLSPGNALYSISNIGLPVRKYIETKISELNSSNTTSEGEGDGDSSSVDVSAPMETDGSATPTPTTPPKKTRGSQGKTPSKSIPVKKPSEDDEEKAGKDVKVDLKNIKRVILDIDLIGVIRKVPTDINDVDKFLKFLANNNLQGKSLLDLLNLPYNELKGLEAPQYLRLLFRFMFDYLCYYQGVRPEDALAKSKTITFMVNEILNEIHERTRTSEHLEEFKKNITNYLNKVTSSAQPHVLNKNLEIIFTQFEEQEFDTILSYVLNLNGEFFVPLIGKIEFDKELAKANDDANKEKPTHQIETKEMSMQTDEVDVDAEKYYLQIFKKQAQQDEELYKDAELFMDVIDAIWEEYGEEGRKQLDEYYEVEEPEELDEEGASRILSSLSEPEPHKKVAGILSSMSPVDKPKLGKRKQPDEIKDENTLVPSSNKSRKKPKAGGKSNKKHSKKNVKSSTHGSKTIKKIADDKTKNNSKSKSKSKTSNNKTIKKTPSEKEPVQTLTQILRELNM
jgi:hypothetical protein